MNTFLCDMLSAQMRVRECGAEGFRAGAYQEYRVPPWVEAPPGYQPFDFNAVITVPVAGTAAVVLSFLVPTGWDGVIKGIAHQYFPGGFTEGSGNIIWRLRVDGQYVRNYDAIRVSFGSLENQRSIPGGIVVYSGQFVEYVIDVPAGSPVPTGPGNETYASVSGYYWARR